jgi:hypothetical protein
MKLGTYIAESEPKKTMNLVNPIHQSVSLCLYPPTVVRQRFCNTVPVETILYNSIFSPICARIFSTLCKQRYTVVCIRGLSSALL